MISLNEFSELSTFSRINFYRNIAEIIVPWFKNDFLEFAGLSSLAESSVSIKKEKHSLKHEQN